MGSTFRALFFSLVLVFTTTAIGAENGAHGYFAIDAGVFANNISQRLSAPSAYKSEVASISGFLRFRPGISLGKRFYFEPSLGFVLPWRTNVDGSTMIFPMQLSLDLSVPLLSFLSLRLGPGMYSELFYGSGGTVRLNNGSSYSDFGAPSGMNLSFTGTVNVALEVLLSHHFSLNLDAYILDIMSRTRRTYHASASLGVKL